MQRMSNLHLQKTRYIYLYLYIYIYIYSLALENFKNGVYYELMFHKSMQYLIHYMYIHGHIFCYIFQILFLKFIAQVVHTKECSHILGSFLCTHRF